MITSLHINNVATYYSPSHLDNLKVVNYIFGANGTGKTTISRALSQASGHEQCRLTWKGDVSSQVMVYNQDFVDKNFSQNSRLQGVFTLGENQVEAERELLQLRLQIEKIDTQIKI